ncbi:MAG: hypothetical protein EOP52_13785 [Sphingobacteriales bacterium]|nr:MAG: hypothetical protein EOP52_13785 [Sphingobacteriales bacterium]
MMHTSTPSSLPESPNVRQSFPVGVLAACLSTLALLLFAVQVMSSSMFSLFALVYFIVFSAMVAKYSPAAFVLLLWFIFIRLTTMVSGVAIESGGYMPEMVMTGFPTGSFVRLALFYTLGIVMAVWFINALLPKALNPNVPRMPVQRWAPLVFGLVILLCAWAFFIGLKSGFPLLSGTDRIVYWKEVSNRFLFFFLGNRTILAALLGVIFVATTGLWRRGALALLILILALSFLFAEKFTSICQILFFFITPIFLLNPHLQKDIARRLIPIGILLACLTLPVILVVYGVFTNPAEAIDRLQVRATAQAEVWFVADQDDGRIFGINTQLAAYNFRSLFALDADAMSRSAPYIGARDFMSQYLETPRYNSYVERGVTLTMATEGYLLKVFGWFAGIPFYWVLLAVYALQVLYFAYALNTYNPLRIIIACKLLVWSNYGLNQGYLWEVIGLPVLALMGLIFAAEAILNQSRRTS